MNLSDRRTRARVCELLLTQGTARDIATWLGGALLVDLWDELCLPQLLRDHWAHRVEAVTGQPDPGSHATTVCG